MSKILNYLLVAVAAFLLCFCWLTYYKQTNWVCYAVSALLAVMFFAALWTFDAKMSNTKPSLKSKKSIAEAQKNALALETNFCAFEEVFLKKGCTIQKQSDDCWLVAREAKILVVYLFKLARLSSQDVINAFKRAKKLNADKIALFCLKYDEDAKQICNIIPLDVTLLNFESVLSFFKEAHHSLPKPLYAKKHSIFDKKILHIALNRNRFKYYFVTALFLLLLSRITFYTLYNIVIATVCFGLSLFCLFNKRFNPKTERFSI